MYDVIIIGAGPSGLNAARLLAEAGLHVVLLEKKNEIGKHVICTGIVGQEAFQEFDLSRDSILREIKKVRLVSPKGNSIIYEHPHPFAYVVDRENFDKSLSQEAQARGVEIELDEEVVDFSVNNNSIDVITRIDGEHYKRYSAQVVIIATGINYKLHKEIGLGAPKDFLHGVQAEIRMGDVNCTHLFAGRDIARGAFAWMVPIGGKTVRLGLMTETDPHRCFKNLMNKINSDETWTVAQDRIQFKAIAQGLVSKTYGERILSIGEAAGQVKTTTGGGIYFGLVCSGIASKVLIKKFKEGNFTARSLAEYEKLWKRVIRKEILVGYYARRICGKLSDIQIEKMFQIVQNDGVIPLIRNRGNFDWHSELILMLLKRLQLFKHSREEKTLH